MDFGLIHLKISEYGLKAAIGLLLLSSFSSDVRVVAAEPPSAPGGIVDGGGWLNLTAEVLGTFFGP